MAIRKIARMGHPILREVARPVLDVADPEIQRLIADMKDTLIEAEGVGLAAPQVHASLALFMFLVPAGRADAEQGVPLTVLINPVIEPLDDTVEHDWEGCLSMPGLMGAVPRWAAICYRGLAADGTLVQGEAWGFHARVMQHEYDHLQGVLYPERMSDLKQLGFADELQRHVL